MPSDTWILPSPLITHRDPEVYPDPLAFRPSRWDKLSPGPYSYLPFGAGPRMCLGAAFATQVLRVVLPKILQKARIEFPKTGIQVDLRTQGITMGPSALPARLAVPGGPWAPPVPVTGRVRALVRLPE